MPSPSLLLSPQGSLTPSPRPYSPQGQIPFTCNPPPKAGCLSYVTHSPEAGCLSYVIHSPIDGGLIQGLSLLVVRWPHHSPVSPQMQDTVLPHLHRSHPTCPWPQVSPLEEGLIPGSQCWVALLAVLFLGPSMARSTVSHLLWKAGVSRLYAKWILTNSLKFSAPYSVNHSIINSLFFMWAKRLNLAALSQTTPTQKFLLETLLYPQCQLSLRVGGCAVFFLWWHSDNLLLPSSVCGGGKLCTFSGFMIYCYSWNFWICIWWFVAWISGIFIVFVMFWRFLMLFTSDVVCYQHVLFFLWIELENNLFLHEVWSSFRLD